MPLTGLFLTTSAIQAAVTMLTQDAAQGSRRSRSHRVRPIGDMGFDPERHVHLLRQITGHVDGTLSRSSKDITFLFPLESSQIDKHKI